MAESLQDLPAKVPMSLTPSEKIFIFRNTHEGRVVVEHICSYNLTDN